MTQTEGLSPLVALPDEVVKDMTTYLSTKDVANLVLSCKRFGDCSSLLLTNHRRCPRGTTEEKLHALCPRLHSSRITSLDLSPGWRITDASLGHDRSFWNHWLPSFILFCSLPYLIPRIIDDSPAIMGIFAIYLWEKYMDIARKSTKISNGNLGALTNLTALNLSKCKNIRDAGLEALAPLTNLTQLDLIECWQTTDAGRAQLRERGVEVSYLR